ncbi:MAG: sigma-54 dependent transcriptional regulator [Candidatus Latescibacter sp.]|nr:sigma-54 dependent transcriptional regulator [Candidatus Latescibacter sp.]
MSEQKGTILIVDDEPIKRSILEEELREAGYSAVAVSNPLEAEPHLKKTNFDVILTDLCMPGQDGISFLKEVKEHNPEQQVLVMTAYGTVETAVDAMKLGAFDYLQKPFSTEELLLKLDRLRKYIHLENENEILRQQLRTGREETSFVGDSEPIRTILARIHAISGTDTTVLIEGESGTGKELVARIIHETSFRASAPFIPVSCAVLPRELVEAELFGYEPGAFTGAVRRRLGRFELAHGGTIFLDDIDDVPLDIQVKLLRVLQERSLERVGGTGSVRVNVRVIAATKRSLAALVKAGAFREDLYYRLNVVPLSIPPLRGRAGDIPILVNYFLKRLVFKLNRGHLTITPAALEKLEHYNWPGNVRELEHILERTVIFSTGNELDVHDIPELLSPYAPEGPVSISFIGIQSLNLEQTIFDMENRIINWALSSSNGNLSQAAEILGIPRSSLQYKLSKLDKQQ